MAAISTRRAKADDTATGDRIAALEARLAQLERDKAVSDRILGKVTARLAPGFWNDFKQLLTGQYSVGFTDAEAFLEILSGRKP